MLPKSNFQGLFLKVFLLFIPVLILSCKKNNSGPSWDTGLLVPILRSEVSISDISGDLKFESDQTGFLSLVYEDTLFNFSGENFFEVRDTAIVYQYFMPAGSFTINPGQSLPFDSVTEFSYSVGDVELRMVRIDSGFINISVSSTLQEMTRYRFRIPGASKDGVFFDESFDVPSAGAGGPGIFTGVYDLSGYQFNLTGKNNNSFNSVYCLLTGMIHPGGSPVTVNAGQSVAITLGFSDIIPEFALGYFGNSLVTIPTSSEDLDLFQTLTSGAFHLEKMKAEFKIENFIGADFLVYPDMLGLSNTTTSQFLALNHAFVGNPFHLNRAVDFPLTPRSWAQNLDEGNSNIISLLELMPNRATVGMTVETNPLGNVSGGNDFMYYDKGIMVHLDMEIPMSLSLENLTLENFSETEVKKQNFFKNVKGGKLKAVVENYFPFSGGLRLYLIQNGVTLDSLVTVSDFLPGVPDSSGKVLLPVSSVLEFPVTPLLIEHLTAMDGIRSFFVLNSYQAPQYVRLYSHYSIKMKLIGDFDYAIE